jgi:hypothetical protein
LETGAPVSLPITTDGQLTDQTSVVIGPIKVSGPPPDIVAGSVAPQTVLNQSFNNQITLLGYDIDFSDPYLKLTLYWQSETSLPLDYTTFLHLRDGSNQNVAQKDSPPAGGRYPTSLWDTGEIIVDEIVLPVDGVSSGEYTPVIGLYNLESGARLPIVGISDNELHLESITVP